MFFLLHLTQIESRFFILLLVGLYFSSSVLNPSFFFPCHSSLFPSLPLPLPSLSLLSVLFNDYPFLYLFSSVSPFIALLLPSFLSSSPLYSSLSLPIVLTFHISFFFVLFYLCLSTFPFPLSNCLPSSHVSSFSFLSLPLHSPFTTFSSLPRVILLFIPFLFVSPSSLLQ